MLLEVNKIQSNEKMKNLIKEEILFKPWWGNGKKPAIFKVKKVGKVRVNYKNKQVLVVPYFFQVERRDGLEYMYYDEELKEDAPVYREIKGKYYYFYFNRLTSPMFQQYRLSLEEAFRSNDINLPHRFYRAYRAHIGVLGFLDYNNLLYALYKEGYMRMEQIAKNIENDLPYYQNISDITLEISDYFSDSEWSELYEKAKLINDKIEGFPYAKKVPYGIALEEWKNLLFKYFGEKTPDGFLGLDENFFNYVHHRTELLYYPIFLHKSLYYFDSQDVPEDQSAYYAYYFFDKKYLANYRLSNGWIPTTVGGFLHGEWENFMRRLFWRRLKVIAKF